MAFIPHHEFNDSETNCSSIRDDFSSLEDIIYDRLWEKNKVLKRGEWIIVKKDKNSKGSWLENWTSDQIWQGKFVISKILKIEEE